MPTKSPVIGFIVGIMIVAYLASLATGGYVLLVNDFAISLASRPYAPLALHVILTLLAASVAVYMCYGITRIAKTLLEGLVAGLLFAASIVGAVAAIAYDAVLAGYVILVSLSLISLHASGVLEAREKRLSLYILAATAVIGASLIALRLYEPIASSRMIEAAYIDKLIDVNGLYRFIPLMTAYVYALDRIQLPTHTIYPEDSYVYYLGNRSVYNWIIEPEGFWNQVTRNPAGVVLVYGDEYPPRVEIIERRLTWGLHNMRFRILYFDTLLRRVILAAGFGLKPLLEDNIEVVEDGRIYILVPLVSWRRSLLGSIPVLHGYAVIDEDGGIVVIEPREAAKRFPYIPLLPEAVARAWIEVYRFHPGFMQVYVYHNTFVIRDVGTNPQPYLTRDTRGRQWWVFVAEPAGRTYSAKYLIYVDASSLEPRLLVYEFKKPVIGVSMVASYVKQAHPNFDWSQLRIEEPIPAVINSRLYWKVTVVTKDYRGLVTVDVVDAKTTRVYSFKPAAHIAYLDVIEQLLAGGVGGKRQQSIEQRIALIEEKLRKIQGELNAVLAELERLKSMLGNVTGVVQR